MTWLGAANRSYSGAVVNRMGGLISAGGGGAYSGEQMSMLKNRAREGFFVNGATVDVNGWPTNAHTLRLSDASTLPGWMSNSGLPMKCGYIGSGTPTGYVNGVVANVVLGNGTTTYTTFDLTASAAGFGFSVPNAAQKHFAYLPDYPGSAIDDPTLPSSITNEAIAHYSKVRHIRTEWHGIALWNSQLMTSSNRNTPTTVPILNQTLSWFSNQNATLTSLPSAGATSGAFTGWTRGPGTWCITFNTGEARICTVASGANPTFTWSGSRPLVSNVTTSTVSYGVEGYPLEIMLALAVAANTGLVICEPCLQDGTNNVAGSYSAATMALVHQYANNYPAWTGTVWWTPGNENWNGTYNSYRVMTESAALGGYADRYAYGGAWLHALANLGRTEFGAQWGKGQRFGAVLEWQDHNPDQFYKSLDYINTTIGTAPTNDIQAIAVAPYMNPTGLSAGSTSAQIITAMTTAATTQAATSNLENVAIMGLHYGIPLMTYEGGPQWNNGTYSGITNMQAAIMDTTNYAPAVVAYYDNIANSGVQIFTHNTFGLAGTLSGGSNTGDVLGIGTGSNYPPTRANTPNWDALMTIAGRAAILTRNVINGGGSVILGGNYADKTGAANPAFPSGTFSTTNGSPYYSLQGYIGWFFNCTAAKNYSIDITMGGSGTPGSNVEIGGLSGFTKQTGFTLQQGLNSAVCTFYIPAGPGYILLGNGTSQSTATVTQIQFN